MQIAAVALLRPLYPFDEHRRTDTRIPIGTDDQVQILAATGNSVERAGERADHHIGDPGEGQLGDQPREEATGPFVAHGASRGGPRPSTSEQIVAVENSAKGLVDLLVRLSWGDGTGCRPGTSVESPPRDSRPAGCDRLARTDGRSPAGRCGFRESCRQPASGGTYRDARTRSIVIIHRYTAASPV